MEVLGQRLDRIEDKLDKLADAMVASAKLDDIESGVQENSNTVKVINKLFWVAIIAASGAIAANIWM